MNSPLAGLDGEQVRHFSKALSSILRGDFDYNWAPVNIVLLRCRNSRRHGQLTITNLPDVLLGNRRFEYRVNEEGIAELRAVR